MWNNIITVVVLAYNALDYTTKYNVFSGYQLVFKSKLLSFCMREYW